MSNIILIDTSVFVNLLNIGRKSDRKEEVRLQFRKYTQEGCEFFLPFATILETGNHIAQSDDATIRAENSRTFIKYVKKAFSANSPFKLSEPPNTSDILNWLGQFEEKAKKGVGFGDLSIIAEYDKIRLKNAHREVFIWSFDRHLMSYRQEAKPIGLKK